uniref:dUTPase-like domain-containing protein n=1 Tax=Anas zonorhyncha TaxID=75864 RepID=A0A8B9V9B8_9AVES
SPSSAAVPCDFSPNSCTARTTGSSCPSRRKEITSLCISSTGPRGSLGVDLATAVSVTLPDKSVVAIPTGIQGPLSNTPLGGLLLGRSSVGLKGLIVIPGIIDIDHVGEIRVMAYTLNPPLFIPKGTKIAQLIALQNYQPRAGALVNREGGFGSSDHDILSQLRAVITTDNKDFP